MKSLYLSIVFLAFFSGCEWRVDADSEMPNNSKPPQEQIMIDTFIHSPFLYPESNPEPVVGYDTRGLKCLSDNVYHEARGEGELGMRLVADVTLNRVLSSEFPSTICKVVYQRSQFSWTTQKRSITERSVYNTAKRIAKNALHRTADKSKGALYFYGHRVVTPTWSWYKKTTVKHKSHTFMR